MCRASTTTSTTCNISLGYDATTLITMGANWYRRSKIDQGATTVTPTDNRPYANWAATTAYTPGKVRVLPSGYAVCCKTGGTSGSVAPSVKNYGVAITDGSCTWELLCANTYSALWLGQSSGENHFDQFDLSGPYSNSILFQGNAPLSNGPSIAVFDDCVLSSSVEV
jgi:hypothetical protein